MKLDHPYLINGPATQVLYERTGLSSQTVIMLPKDRGVLHQRIGERFEQMLQQGFLAEVEALVSRCDLHPGMPSMRAVGYRQAVAHLMGECITPNLLKRVLLLPGS